MRRFALAILAAATVAAFVVSEVHAQAAVIPQWMRNGLRVTVQQGADAFPVTVQNPPETFAIFKPNWLNTVLQHRLAGGPPPSPSVMQDSTTAEDVRGANWLALMLYPTFRDSTSAQLVAMQVRWHFTQGAVDTGTTYIEQATRTFPQASPSATVRDSVGSLLYGDAATPFGVNKYGSDADSVATPDEQVLVFTNVVGQNRGRLIRLTPPNAPPGYSAGPFISVRFRHLNSQNLAGAWQGNGVSGFEQSFRLNVAMVGGR